MSILDMIGWYLLIGMAYGFFVFAEHLYEPQSIIDNIPSSIRMRWTVVFSFVLLLLACVLFYSIAWAVILFRPFKKI